jgi:CBS domain-containing protein
LPASTRRRAHKDFATRRFSDTRLQARGDCTLAFLPGAELAAPYAACPLVTAHLRPPSLETASGPANPGSEPHLGLMHRPAGQLVKRPPVTVPPSASIADTARLMSEQRVSSVLLLERDLLFGLVTDRDLRNRVLAAGLDPQLPVHRVATLAPLTIGAAQPALEALLLMARHNIHHLRVMDGHRVAGMITATDLPAPRAAASRRPAATRTTAWCSTIATTSRAMAPTSPRSPRR